MAVALRSQRSISRPSGCRSVAKPVHVRQIATLQKPRDVQVNFFKFRQDSTDAGVYGSQGRDDYSVDDVEHYFNYMGMLAVEGTYDRMELMLSSGLEPVDVLLLMAASEDDTPKVEELLQAGANINIADSNGKSPLQLATKPEVKQLLEAAAKVGA
eukprot:gene13492-13617_t